MDDSTDQMTDLAQEPLQQVLDRAIEDGVLTNDEHDQLMTRIHRDGQIDPEESAIISRLFALIREGKLKIVDSDREAAEIIRKKELENKAAAAEPESKE